MSTKPQIELFLENESGTQQVAYPFVESDHVSLSNGMDIDTMIRQDVSMPTVAHEDLSFKVGVGDQDVSSAIVDSSVAEMTIKGKTYKNILPEPSTHVLTNNKEMFKVNEGLDPNVEIVDGVSKSAILKGNTLVNILNGNVSINENVPYHDYKTDIEFKANAVYTAIFKVESEATSITCGLLEDGGTWNGGLVGVRSGYNKVLLTPSTTKTYGLRIRHFDGASVAINTSDVMLIEGDYTNVDIPYFEGMQSVKLPVLTTIGKNLAHIQPKEGVSYSKNGITVTFNSNKQTILVNGTCNADNTVFYFEDTHIELKEGDVVRGFAECLQGTGGKIAFRTNTEGWTASLSTLIERGNATGSGMYTARSRYIMNGHGIRIDSGESFDNAEYRWIVVKNETNTSYEPYKSNILTVNEDVTLCGIGEVKDGFNLLTGELTQRIKELVLNGSESGWFKSSSVTGDGGYRYALRLNDGIVKDHAKIMCDKFIQSENAKIGYVNYLVIDNGLKSALYFNSTAETVDEWKAWLAENNVKVQYQLATESVKTVDLSSFGNWDKVVLDGSESWSIATAPTQTNTILLQTGKYKPTTTSGFTEKLKTKNNDQTWSEDYEAITFNVTHSLIQIRISKTIATNIDEWKEYLANTPMIVYCMTNAKKSNSIKEMLSFSNGHIQLSSGADNSLIPTLDYQAKTSNSYVMDLMKANTRYTMKAKSASGTFTIDGTSYGAGTNGTFTTPSSMTNKFLVVSNKTNEEVMILEGDVTDKTIPYFKGIKSAFEDEDKIEVLSTGKNLYPYGDSTYTPEHSGWYFINGDRQTLWGEKVHKDCGQGAWFYLDEGRYYFSVVNNNNVQTLQVIGDKEQLYGDGTLIPSGWYALRMSVKNANEKVNITNIMVEKATKTTYEPHKSNSTKIPLLSPLKSLPNGVCDEIILDRENNKAKVIQRVGKVVLDGSEDWVRNSAFNTTETAFFYLPNPRIPSAWGRISATFSRIPNNRFVSTTDRATAVNQKIEWISGGDGATGMIQILIKKERLSTPDVSGFKQWLSLNPVTVQYELETPIVTEVDLEGFPYVYKDGHIFLNGEIAPVTEIKYSINQQHQIEASNQDIIRHQKEIDYLYKLIGEYVRVDYKNTLLSLNLELK